MRTIGLDLCLSLAVLATWLGAFGFLRLRSALDRLHCTTFVLATAGPLVALASVLDEGWTTRSLKIAVLIVVLLVTGAAASHAVGRAVLLRDGSRA